MSERGLIGDWLARSVLQIERMHFLMCMALGLVFAFQSSHLYFFLMKHFPILTNGFIVWSVFIFFFLLGVWCGGLMLWKTKSLRYWLDVGHVVELPGASFDDKIAAEWWCEYNLKWHRWRMLKNGNFLFANSKQAMYFKLKWMNSRMVKLYDMGR